MSVKDTQAKRISAAKLSKAKKGIVALCQISDYSPQRKAFDASHAQEAQDVLKKSQDAEIAAVNALALARDAAAKAEWAVYDFMIEAGDQVAGQYGANSDEYASIGYKKRSEYKKGRPGKQDKG